MANKTCIEGIEYAAEQIDDNQDERDYWGEEQYVVSTDRNGPQGNDCDVNFSFVRWWRQ